MRLVALAVLGLVACRAAPAPAPSPDIGNIATDPGPDHKLLDLRYMARGYFYAGSPIDVGLGGNASSGNLPRPSRGLANGPPDLHARVFPDEPRALRDGYTGMRVVIVNASARPVAFSAQDGRIYVVQEAVRPDGTWAPIEYLPSSWCGNSYHELTLPAGQHWEFSAPRYTGSFSTKLRVRVSPTGEPTGRVIYSNTFTGRVNLEQFSEKEGHTPTNIMDPYNE